ncbi:MAG: hypothetical protein J5J00_17230 [Deltaproteobacteria bacterium]|nr:hypothetical protein [Deltaproteobacteria bacterium]
MRGRKFFSLIAVAALPSLLPIIARGEFEEFDFEKFQQEEAQDENAQEQGPASDSELPERKVPYVKVLPGQRQFDPLSPEVAQDLVTKAIAKQPVHIRGQTQIYPAEEQLLQFWMGNKPSLIAKVEKGMLLFKSHGIAEGSAKRPVVIDFKIDKDEIILRHRTAMAVTQRGGLRISGERHVKPNNFFYRALNGTSMVVLVPPFNPKSEIRGVVLCPREFPLKGSRAARSQLAPVKWEPEDLRISVDGEARGTVRSSIEMVQGKAYLTTSPAVIPSVSYEDYIYSKTASVSLYYKPRPDTSRQVLPLADRAEGIEAKVDLHANTGFHRISRLANLVYLKPVESPAFDLNISIEDLKGTVIAAELAERGFTSGGEHVAAVPVQAGECYALVHDHGTVIHDYSKEHLKPPAEKSASR